MELKLNTSERLRKQEELLERIYRANYAQNPYSLATKISRSNLIAVQHTARQVYGTEIPQDVPELAISSNQRPKRVSFTEKPRACSKMITTVL